MIPNDQNVEIAKQQDLITSMLVIDGRNLIFNFKDKNGTVRFDLVTINPKQYDQSFLFHTTNGTDKVDALKKMLEYIEQHYA